MKTIELHPAGVADNSQIGVYTNKKSFAKHFKGRLASSTLLPLILLMSCLALLLRPTHCSAQQTATTLVSRDGSHDFDFNIGTWKTNIKRLKNPLSGTTEWINMEGTVTVRKVWGGKASLEEIEVNSPGGHWEGATLFLYNPTSRQWSQNFVSAGDNILESPTIGSFKNNVGELYAQETHKGRRVLVKGTWSHIVADSHQYEEAYSADGGKTWETYFSASLTRIK